MLSVAFTERLHTRVSFTNSKRNILNSWSLFDSESDRVKNTAAQIAEISVTIWRLVIKNRLRFRHLQAGGTINGKMRKM